MPKDSRFTIIPKSPATAPSLGFKAAPPAPETADTLSLQNDLPKKKILVLWNQRHKNVLHDPMTGQPVHSRHKNFLEPIAKEYHCEIINLDEALKRLLKYHGHGNSSTTK